MKIGMFIPACGNGTRVSERGIKPFLQVKGHSMALDMVMAQAPVGMDIELAIPAAYADQCPDFRRSGLVVTHPFEPTSGQAETIARWLKIRHESWTHVLISNCDNDIDNESVAIGIHRVLRQEVRGCVFGFQPVDWPDLRYSYMSIVPSSRLIIDVKEKLAISRWACAGVYLLEIAELEKALRSEDEYLSAALARMPGLYMLSVNHLRTWGTMPQIDEVEQGIPQFKMLK